MPEKAEWAIARTYAWNKKNFVLSFRPYEYMYCAMAVRRFDSRLDICDSTVPHNMAKQCAAEHWRWISPYPPVSVCYVLRQANQEMGFFYAFLFLILAMGLLLLMIAAQSYRRRRRWRSRPYTENSSRTDVSIPRTSVDNLKRAQFEPIGIMVLSGTLICAPMRIVRRQLFDGSADGYFVWNFSKLFDVRYSKTTVAVTAYQQP